MNGWMVADTQSLKGRDICQEAKLIAVVERYAAMVAGRTYRKALHGKEILREFLIEKGQFYDQDISMLLISELGIFPPGNFVRLASGETAVVIKRAAESSMFPLVSSFLGPRGAVYLKPLIRNSSETEYQIRDTCSLEKRIALNPSQLWGYV